MLHKTRTNTVNGYLLQKNISDLNRNSNVGIFTEESWLDVPLSNNSRKAAFMSLSLNFVVVVLVWFRVFFMINS